MVGLAITNVQKAQKVFISNVEHFFFHPDS
jgi:hypothetical protein